VLYLAFYFPPSRGSGVYRIRATANHLAEQGWDVTTFAAPLPFLDKIGSDDPSLVETVDPRIRVIRPDFRQYRWNRDIKAFSWFRRNFPVVANSLHEWSLKRIFPEPYALWALAAVRRALAMHARKRFDLVVASGNPFASFGAAWCIGKLGRIPFVVDYRDAWTLDQFTEQPRWPAGHPAWAWENRVLRDAGAAVFVNQGMRDYHAAKYPAYGDRMIVTLNGWDPDLMPAVTTTDPAGAMPTGSAGDRPLRFTFLGTLTGVQPLEELIGAFETARQHPDLAGADLDLHGYMGFFGGAEQLRKRMGIDAGGPRNGVHYRGPVPKTEVGAVYEDSDVLVFMTGGGKYVTTGKVFEYMATGRPIVSVHLPDIAAVEVLRGYPLWFTANSMDVAEIANSMVAAGKAARDLTPDQRAAARAYADRYTRQAVLEPLEQRLRQLVDQPKDPA
jgi:glycosyltransferase involved in cell wall biosynthesis